MALGQRSFSNLKGRSYQITGDPKLPPESEGSWVKMMTARVTCFQQDAKLDVSLEPLTFELWFCFEANFRAAGWKNEDFEKPIITGCY